MIEILKLIFPQLNDENLLSEISKNATLIDYHKDKKIIRQGDPIHFIPLVTKGEIKVFRFDKSGNSIYLYSLYRGDLCAMSISCCISNHKSNLTAIAASDVEIFAIPVNMMDKWLSEFKIWRVFVFNNYRNKFDELISNINDIAFLNLEERLIKLLKTKAERYNGIIKITHQQLADELNSSREVISRLLKQLETENKISIKRNLIIILNL